MNGTPQPKSIANDLIDRLNHLVENGSNDLAIRSIKRDAGQLLKSEAHDAYVVLGAVACLEGKIDEMRDFHLRAIKLQPKDSWALKNFSHSLRNNGFIHESLEYLREAVNCDPADPALVSELINMLVINGQLHQIPEWLQRLKKLSSETTHPIESSIGEFLKMLDAKQLQDKDLSQMLRMALDLMHARNLKFHGIAPAYSDQGIIYSISIAAPVDDIVDLNFRLAAALAKNDYIPRVSHAARVAFRTIG